MSDSGIVNNEELKAALQIAENAHNLTSHQIEAIIGQVVTTAENRVDESWLNSIAKQWNEVTGKPWDTRDGETPEEGRDANVGSLFQFIEDLRTRLAEVEADAAVMRWLIRGFLECFEDQHDESGLHQPTQPVQSVDYSEAVQFMGRRKTPAFSTG